MRSELPQREIEDFAAPENIELRPLQAGDSIEQLTDTLHRAFARLGEMGVPCSCVCQPPEVTRQRISRGSCFVAMRGDQLVGTITLYGPELSSDSRSYRETGSASARQLGVDPEFQGNGIGSALLKLAAQWARRHGYNRLTLDTPEPASHLIHYYLGLGFRVVETLQFTGRPYRSVIFAMPLVDAAAVGRRMCGPQAEFRSHASASAWDRHDRQQADNMRRSKRCSRIYRCVNRKPWRQECHVHKNEPSCVDPFPGKDPG